VTELVPAVGVDANLTASVEALPLPSDDNDARWTTRRATAAWLHSQRSIHTRRAYFRDLAAWLRWCETTGLDPRQAKRGDVDMYIASTRIGQLSKTSQARCMAALSSWYRYLITNDVTAANPAATVSRPRLDKDTSTTAGLTGEQVRQFMRAALHTCTLRDAAILGMLAELGLRVGEAIALNLEDVRTNRGHRTVRVTGKGVKTRELPIPPPLARTLDAYLEVRSATEGPMFITRTGKRLDQPAVFRLVRRVAATAGLPEASSLSPHSLRHTVTTAALDAGAELRDVQDMMGHLDPRTTRRYDRSRGSLDRSPAYLIAGLFADEGDVQR